MARIELTYDRGFTWTSNGRVYVKGFLYHRNSCLQGEALMNHFDSVSDESDLQDRLREANGLFSVIITTGRILVACDPVRVFPVFYMHLDDDLYLSDNAGYLLSLLERQTGKQRSTLFNQTAIREYRATGYVTGRETLISAISQVQAGEMVSLTGDQLKRQFYHSYQSDIYLSDPYPARLDRLEQLLEESFKRLLTPLGERMVVVPLSGGYDSRLIAAMLKKMGHRKVLCYTYGRKGAPDIEPSREVASRLGFPWHFIEYQRNLTEDYIETADFQAYYPYSANLVSMFFMQEYFAVRALKERRLIDEDAVFVPGHSGDFIAGSMFLKHGIPAGQVHPDVLARKILDIKYVYCRMPRKSREQFLDRIRKSLEDKRFCPGAISHTIYEDWDMKEKFAKFIVNSCNVYSWFGYEYRLPLWDAALVDFFRQLPFPDKENKKLFDEVLTSRIFDACNLNFAREVQPSSFAQKGEYLKSLIRKAMTALFGKAAVKAMPFISGRAARNDPLCYNEITAQMQAQLHREGKEARIDGGAYNSLIIKWYLHKIT